MPDATLVAPDGHIKPEFVWAALDCPGGWAVAVFQREPQILLGQLTVEIVCPLPGGEQYVAVGWPIAKEGRKCRAGTAIFSTPGPGWGRMTNRLLLRNLADMLGPWAVSLIALAVPLHDRHRALAAGHDGRWTRRHAVGRAQREKR